MAWQGDRKHLQGIWVMANHPNHGWDTVASWMSSVPRSWPQALETRLACAGVWEVPRPRALFPAGPGGGELVGEAGGAMQMDTCGLAVFSGAASL